MRQVFVNEDHARVGLYQSLLEEAGISTFIRNGYGNTVGGMPSPLFFPALCVVNDEDYPRALQILGDAVDQPATPLADWGCPKCGEEVPGTFDSCWHCGTLRPDLTSPDELPATG